MPMIAAYPDYQGRFIVDFADVEQMDGFDTVPSFVLPVALAKLLLDNWNAAIAALEAAIEEADKNPKGIIEKNDD
jgi:hypothetical protein